MKDKDITQHLIKDAKRRRKQLEEPTWPYYLGAIAIGLTLAVIIIELIFRV